MKKRTNRYSTKFWILPNGLIAKLNYPHDVYIIYHRDTLSMMFSTSSNHVVFKKRSNIHSQKAINLEALNNGFSKVNFQHRSGTLVCEMTKLTEDIRTGIVNIIVKYLNKINHVEINIVGARGGLKRHYSATLFQYDNDFDKFAALPSVLKPIGARI
jgi:hypothetical protein